ncbi:DNA polymerase ligase N-terminal domain-containing protein [uncultured Jatrophihabitans sp.]|uniref:DNA polymerase ligase N-terminal domain-containing protein n=1 Tax=uncultured Jatrophihabitans sp. TaxID=1610747 RepID=UPI0035CC2857
MTDPIFVIQHHLATADHYDVRFEIQGVLVSWAVPKGPSTDPRVRRLAKRTGDHDLAYADYEGVLGPRRGGGTVQVWDRGTFRNISRRKGEPISAAEALDEGHLSVDVAGEKISGGYTLIRTGGDMWLLIKHKGAGADPSSEPTSALPESVLTGRTMAQIAEQG